ncbi:MAG: sensor histidine kinase [Burkholderiales bacterium]
MTKKTRVLIVEDDNNIARALTIKLERLGYEITGVVDNGIDAIREAGATQPDIVLMDIVLKGQMDGIETAKIVQRDYGLPVIFLTSHADDSTIEKAEQSGAQGYVLKPVKERELHAMIKLAMNRHRRTGEFSHAAPGADNAEPGAITEQQQVLIEEIVAKRTRELREANAELETLSYSVSHDLRVPLRAIIGFAAMLGDTARDKLDAEEARILDSVQRAGKRMSHQIDALLDLSRLSHSERLTETIDLSELAGSVLRNLMAQYPSMKIEADIQSGLQVRGDPGMIRGLVENLLGNALKFSSGQPVARIRLFLAQTPQGEAFCVADEGAGFDMGHADRLFGVFQRLHSEREFPGTGIGLASVKRIVTRHGGKVWAESEPGKGAKFYFTIPSDSSVQP